MYRSSDKFIINPIPSWSNLGFWADWKLQPTVQPYTEKILIGQETKGGVGCPNYAFKIKHKMDASTARTVVFHNVRSSPAFWLRTFRGTIGPVYRPSSGTEYQGGSMSLQFPMGCSLPDPLTIAERSSLLSSCRIKFQQKVEQRLSQFDAPVFFAELKETLEMLKRPIPLIIRKTSRFIEKVIRIIKRRPQRRRSGVWWRRLDQRIADMYLGWTLGVSPLIQDVEDAAVAVARFNERQTLKVRCSTSIEKGNDSGTTGAILGQYQWHRFCRARASINASISMADSTVPGLLPRLQQLTRTDFRGIVGGFIPTVWELIPMSFIADYFTNIGEVLRCNFSIQPVYSYLSTTVVSERIRLCRIQMNVPTTQETGWLTPPVVDEIQSRGYIEHCEKTIARTLSLPPAIFELKMPSGIQMFTTAVLFKQLSRLRNLL